MKVDWDQNESRDNKQIQAIQILAYVKSDHPPHTRSIHALEITAGEIDEVLRSRRSLSVANARVTRYPFLDGQLQPQSSTTTFYSCDVLRANVSLEELNNTWEHGHTVNNKHCIENILYLLCGLAVSLKDDPGLPA